MKTVIVSAFGPFGAYPANSSELVVRHLLAQGVPGFELAGVIFECVIPEEDRGWMLLERARSFGAVGIVSLGMASEKKGLCIERQVRNAVHNEKYCPPQLQRTRIETCHAYGHVRSLNFAPWNLWEFGKACQAAHIPIEYSEDAGGFCCNHLAYQARRALEEKGMHLPYLFVHLPCCPEAVPSRDAITADKITLPVETMTAGIRLLLQHALL